MDYIRFSVHGQKLDYDKRYYSSTETIDTLYCNFKFETDGLGHIIGGWNLPYFWAQFHDEEGNVYVKTVTADNTCSIPYNCLRQHKFKMTLFATDTENYMECTKRYTTNEVLFIFNGLANLNYDGGISPDEPIPTQWQILIDKVDACESSVDGLSQDVSSIESAVSSIDERVTTNTNAIDGLSQNVTSMQNTVNELSTGLDAESTARSNEDSRLEGLIGDESTTRANADTRLEGLVADETAARETADANLQSLITAESTARSSEDARLEGLIGDRYTKTEADALLANEAAARANEDTRIEGLINDESTARENADANLRLLINDEVNERISGDNALQQSINALDTRETGHYNDCKSRIDDLDTRTTTNENDIEEINTVIESIKGTGAGFHSSIYRGKYLGDTYTDDQKQAIASGSFDDLFVGDYWTINGVNWRIADFDYYYNIGDTNFAKHHVVIVPDRILYSAQMNSENITTGAYTGSEMYTTNLDNARTAFDNAFGNQFIPTHRGFYANAVSGSNPSGWSWRDMRVELMSEEQVYGHSAWGVASHNGFDVGTQKTQFKLFTLDQTKINIRQYYWLTNVCYSYGFAFVNDTGLANGSSASNSSGVRPFACLVGA